MKPKPSRTEKVSPTKEEFLPPPPPFYFRREYALPEEIRRIAAEQLEEALTYLTQFPDPHKAIHEARKRLKKIRALVRMIRPELGHELYSLSNALLRDAGGLLSDLRDATSRMEALDKLHGHFPKALTTSAHQAVKETLVQERENLSKTFLVEQQLLAKAAEQLASFLPILQSWPLELDSFETIGPGLYKVYRRGHHALEQAYLDPTAENFHTWRKRVKYLWHQIQLLQELWPAVLLPLEGEIHQLADYLGDDHDLAIFEEMLADRPEAFGDKTHQDLLLELFSQQSAHLRARAFFLGRKVFQESPGAFINRFSGYWNTWKQEGREMNALS